MSTIPFPWPHNYAAIPARIGRGVPSPAIGAFDHLFPETFLKSTTSTMMTSLEAILNECSAATLTSILYCSSQLDQSSLIAIAWVMLLMRKLLVSLLESLKLKERPIPGVW